MRLIDADELKNNLLVKGINSVWDLLKNAPLVDAVPVIRCKDCKWGKEVCENIECWADMNLPPEYHGYDWYCPSGERKEE